MYNYKVVSVYSGYGENSVYGKSRFVEGMTVKSVCRKVLKEKKKSMKGDKSYFDEFVNYWGVKDGRGYVGDGEEGFIMVIGSYSKWWNLIEKMDDWNDEVWKMWEDICNVSEYNEEGKI